MNIYTNELKNLRRQTILWTAVLSILILLFLSLYPTYYDNKDIVSDSLENLPETVRNAMGLNLETLFTPTGFYSFIFSFVLIIGAIQSAILGVKIIASDKINQTEEFLFTKPIKRNKALTLKILAATTSLLITNIIFYIISMVLMSIVNGNQHINMVELFEINTSLILLQLTFMSISMVIAAFIKKPKTIMPLALATVFGFYLLSLVENALEWAILRYINPFSYFKVSDIVAKGQYHASFLIATAFIIIFCLNFSYCGYEQEDIIG